MSARPNPRIGSERADGTEPVGDDAVASLTDIKPAANASGPRADRRQRLRRALLLGGPLVAVIVGLLIWFFSGRYVSTEDAYVKADKVNISAEVSGPITHLAVHENQHIDAGQELFTIDDRPYRIALAKANAELQNVIADINSLKAGFRQKSEQLALARTNRDFAQREYQRQLQLAKRHLNSQVQLDDAKHQFDVASQQISVIEQERAQILSRLDGNPDLPADQHPNYQAARAARDDAALDLERTVVRAPYAGVASKVPQLGQYVNSGSPVMSVVGTDHMWVEANFMETDLTHVRVGQPVSIDVDGYPGHRWHGKVLSIAQATGSEFSILPPQNASGNWVKVVQRIPVRVTIEPRAGDPPLRVGMTANVEIDTGRRHTLGSLLHLSGDHAQSAPLGHGNNNAR